MKRWPPAVEQWRKFATWECKDIPVDLVLSIIARESGGKVGEPARAKSRKAMVLDDQGRTVPQDRAFGLMQCIGPLLKTWQDAGKEPKITINDMFGKDERAARSQIILGCWYFANCVRALHLYDSTEFPGQSPGTASDEQLRLAIVAYRIGWGGKSKPGGRGLKPKLDELRANSWPLTLQSLAKAFPLWGAKLDEDGKVIKWINRPVHFAKVVWNNYAQVTNAGGGQAAAGWTALASTTAGQGQAMQPVAGATGPPGTSKKKDGFLGDYWPLLLIAAAFLFLKMRNSQQEETDETEGAAA